MDGEFSLMLVGDVEVAEAIRRDFQRTAVLEFKIADIKYSGVVANFDISHVVDASFNNRVASWSPLDPPILQKSSSHMVVNISGIIKKIPEDKRAMEKKKRGSIVQYMEVQNEPRE